MAPVFSMVSQTNSVFRHSVQFAEMNNERKIETKKGRLEKRKKEKH
jgi:hypothetical protein